MRTVTSEIQLLYEEHDSQLFPSFPDLVNGLREHADRVAAVLQIVHKLDPVTVLDIGCNRGLFGLLMRYGYQHKKHITGIDISRLSAKYAKEVMGYDEALVLNASEPFVLGRQFDLVLCMEILEHVPTPEILIDNVAIHVALGGFALLSCPNEHEPVDGEFHVRHVSLAQLERWVAPHLLIRDSFTLPSLFCEKPRWQGWHFVIAQKSA